jgi:hypothetical protein
MTIRLPFSLVASWPGIYATDGVPEDERLVVAKFFNPAGAGTWFVLEADALTDPEAEIWEPLAQAMATGVEIHDVKFFGFVTGLGFDELGYFLLSELEAYRGPFGIGIELDAHFEPETLAAVRGRKAA